MGRVLDELTAHVNETVESALEIDYRAAVINVVTSADDRSQLEAATDQLAIAIADHRRDTASLMSHCQRVGAVLQLPESERSLAHVVARSPEPWRGRLGAAAERLHKTTMMGRQQLIQAHSAVRANERLVEASIDAAITDIDGSRPSGGNAERVTYGDQAPGSQRPRLIDGRA